MADVETSIRITAETKAALQNLAALDTQMGTSARAVLAASNNAGVGFSRMDNAMGVLAKRSTPALGAAFGSLSSQAISMTTGFSGASGVLSTLGQSMLAAWPIIGGITIAAAALTAVLIKKKDAIKKSTEAMEPNLEMLRKLAEANDAVSRSAQTRFNELVSEKQARLEVLKLQLRDLENSPKVLTALQLREAGIDGVFDAETAEQIAAQAGLKTTKERTVEADKLREAIANLRAEIDAATSSTVKLPADFTKFTTIEEHAQAVRDAAAEAARNAAEAARAEAARNKEPFGPEAPTFYEMEQEAAAETARAVAAAEKQKQDAVAGTQKAILTANQMRVVAVAQGAAKMLLLEKKNIGEVLAAVMAGVAAELSAKAILWAAEGLALMFTPGRQAEAGAKFAAAAAAGVGAGALATISSSFEKDQGAQGNAGNAAIGGASGGGGSTGRTLVSQGPVTLYYSATMVINGHVFDKSDIYAEFDLWNQDQLRRAGVDLSQRAR